MDPDLPLPGPQERQGLDTDRGGRHPGLAGEPRGHRHAPLVFPPLPANATTFSSTTSNTLTAQTNQVSDLAVTLQVLPGKSDAQNSIIITLTDHNGRFISDAQVEVNVNMQIMDMGTTRQTLHANNSIYTMALDKGKGFNMAGLWSVSLSIQRPGQAPLQTTFQINIQ